MTLFNLACVHGGPSRGQILVAALSDEVDAAAVTTLVVESAEAKNTRAKSVFILLKLLSFVY